MNKLHHLVIAGLIISQIIIMGWALSADRTKVIHQKEFQTITEVVPDPVTKRELNILVRENKELQARLKELKAKPQLIVDQVVYVEGSQEILNDFPDSYTYVTKDGLTVASHSRNADGVALNVYDITVNSRIVISEDKQHTRFVHTETKVKTSFDEKEITVLSEPTVYTATERPVFNFAPQVEVSVGFNINGDYTAGAAAFTGVEYGRAWLGVGVDVSNRHMQALAKLQIRF